MFELELTLPQNAQCLLYSENAKVADGRCEWWLVDVHVRTVCSSGQLFVRAAPCLAAYLLFARLFLRWRKAVFRE